MSIKAILFDLDGTLLPMEQDTFAKAYFKGLAAKAAPHGYLPDELIETVWAGTAAMIKNDGTATNEEVFWQLFAKKYGTSALKDKAIFDDFYENEFEQVKKVCGFNPQARACIKSLKAEGCELALATNPIFPRVATAARIRWAGLDSEDFKLCTTYEVCSYCKPNPKYYLDILNTLKLTPEECLMVGNDVEEDMIAENLGMQVFLITDCVINKKGKDLSKYPKGDFNDLLEYIKQI